MRVGLYTENHPQSGDRFWFEDLYIKICSPLGTARNKELLLGVDNPSQWTIDRANLGTSFGVIVGTNVWFDSGLWTWLNLAKAIARRPDAEPDAALRSAIFTSRKIMILVFLGPWPREIQCLGFVWRSRQGFNTACDVSPSRLGVWKTIHHQKTGTWCSPGARNTGRCLNSQKKLSNVGKAMP